MNPQLISIDDYDYRLPADRIARHPLQQRDSCRLLAASADYHAPAAHCRFHQLPTLLPQDALLVRNNTRVIPARLRMHKPTGAAVEIFLLDPALPSDYARCFEALGSCEWMCIVGNLKKWHQGAVSCQADDNTLLRAYKVSPPNADGLVRVRLEWQPSDMDCATLLERMGRIPIPPYLERDTELSDNVDYQTVYSLIRGSVAAPTAGLHFTPQLFAELQHSGIEIADVTLHVGAGTFKPVKSDTVAGHHMHTERFEVTEQLVRKLIDALQSKRKVIAIGTTSVRTLESLPLLGAQLMQGNEQLQVNQWEAYGKEMLNTPTITALQALADHMQRQGKPLQASTAMMIAPGFHWRVVQGMVTNFHQPRSTLLLLVSSFLERNGGDGHRWQRLYDQALEVPDYRFLSYGDACLLL